MEGVHELEKEKNPFFCAFKKIYFCSFTVVLPFSPIVLPYPVPHNQSPHPIVCVHEPSIRVPLLAIPLLSPIIPLPTSPCSLVTVSFFFISMSLVIFCLLVCFVDSVPLTGEIIWCFSITIWLISLSIMLSSSIHDVAKGRSSFFLSSVQYSFHCVNVQQFLIHSFTDGHLGCFQHLAIIKLCCYEH